MSSSSSVDETYRNQGISQNQVLTVVRFGAMTKYSSSVLLMQTPIIGWKNRNPFR
jgi:hypothetical protein